MEFKKLVSLRETRIKRLVEEAESADCDAGDHVSAGWNGKHCAQAVREGGRYGGRFRVFGSRAVPPWRGRARGAAALPQAVPRRGRGPAGPEVEAV